MFSNLVYAHGGGWGGGSKSPKRLNLFKIFPFDFPEAKNKDSIKKK